MRVLNKSKVKRPAGFHLMSASAGVLEPMEKRMMMSVTPITTWNFDNSTLYNGETIVSPPTSTGTGTASTVGMTTTGLYTLGNLNTANQSSGTFTLTVTDGTGAHTTPALAYNATAATIQSALQHLTVASGNSSFGATTTSVNIASDSGATLSANGSLLSNPGIFFVASNYPTTSATGPDASNLTTITGTSDTATTNNLGWKIVGTNGWNSSAGIGTQGVQFSTSTTGDSNIVLVFDLLESAKGVGSFQVQYSTNNGTSWANVSSLSTAGNGNISVVTNSSAANTVQGTYFLTAAASQFNGLTAILPSDAANQANLSVRIVTATNGTSQKTPTGGAVTNTSGNWTLDDVQIASAQASPVVLASNPVNQTAGAGVPVTFTASATGFPPPTVQWYKGAPGSGTLISGATSPSYTFTATSALNNSSYYATFTNTNPTTQVVSTVTTAAATLTVQAGTIVTQPVSQTVTAGGSLTFTSVEQDNSTASVGSTVQWQTSAGGVVTNVPYTTRTVTNNSTGVNTVTTTLIITPTSALSGGTVDVVYTNTNSSIGSITSTPAAVTVIGAPITQWNFTQGEGSLPAAAEDSPANHPNPTLSNSSTDASSILGLQNDYSTPLGMNAIESYPEADILPETSTVNTSFTEYVWRVRGGLGETGTGAPGYVNADGWSQQAPEYAFASAPDTTQDGVQGVEFSVNTQGYNNVTLSFDWNQGGIGDMQPQYYDAASSTWKNAGPLIQATGSDYYGVTSSTNPTGVFVNLQGIAAANNNPNFIFRLVTAYDPGLPLVTDGNNLDPTIHGQYGAAGFGATSAVQQLTLGTGNYTLTVGGVTSGTINNYGSSDPTDNIAAITAALLPILGSTTTGSVVTNNFTVTQADIGGSRYLISFSNGLKNTPEATFTSSVVGSGTAPTVVTTVDGATGAVTTSTIDASDTFTSGTAINVNVVSANGLIAGDTVVIGGNSVLINSITGTVLNVTPQGTVVQSTIPYGTTVSLEGVGAYSDGGGSWALGNISFNGLVNTGAPTVFVQPQSVTVPGTPAVATVTFTSKDYSEFTSTPTTNNVVWKVNRNDGNGYVPAPTISGGGFTYSVVNTNVSNGTSSNVLSSTYTITGAFPSDGNGSFIGNGYTYEAFFTNNISTTPSYPATLNIVAPAVPTPATLQSIAVQVGNTAVFTSTATGLPSPTVTWQTSIGGIWTNISANTNSSAGQLISISTTNFTSSVTSSLSLFGVPQTENQSIYRAVYFNAASTAAQAGIATNNAILTVLSNETILSDWNFDAGYPTVNASKTTADPYTNSPLPTSGINNGSGILGTASIVGMTLAYSGGDPATGSDGAGTEPAGDIVNSASALNTAFAENTWRVRGADAVDGSNQTLLSSGNTPAGSPANGWSNLALQGTQGAQWMVNTTGYANVYVTLDWYATTSGILDGRQQYTLDGKNWYNLDDHQLADTVNSDGTQTGNLDPNDPFPTIQAVSNDFYGITAANGTIPLVFNLTNVPGAANNPNFGIRFTSAYNQTLVDSSNGLHDEYANAALVGSPPGPQQYNGSKGNWRFNNIVFHGDPTWLDPASAATWNQYSNTLTVTGTATIIGDPKSSAISDPTSVGSTNGLTGVTTVTSGNSPIIVGNSVSDVLTINSSTPDVNIASLTLSSGATAVVTSNSTPQVLIVAPGANTLSLTGTSSLDLGTNMIDLQANTTAQQNSLQSEVVALLTEAYNAGWTGTSGGIFSSSIASSPQLMSIGYLSNSGGFYGSSGPLGTFDGSNPSVNDVLIRYTYYGDANLDGKVDGTDYSDIDTGFLSGTATTWASGNFNYDGVVDGSDYTLIDNAYNRQNNPLAGAAAQIAGESGKFASGTAIRYATPTDQIATATTDQTKKKTTSWVSSLIDSIVTN